MLGCGPVRLRTCSSSGLAARANRRAVLRDRASWPASSWLGAARAVGQDDACLRLLARDPVGPRPAVSSGALWPLPGWAEGILLPLAVVVPLARSAVTRQHRHGRRPDGGLVQRRAKEAYRCVMTR